MVVLVVSVVRAVNKKGAVPEEAAPVRSGLSARARQRRPTPRGRPRQIGGSVSGSRTAMSARTLRSSSMPASLRPWMNGAVGHAVLARGGVDARDPQAAEVALAVAAVAVRVGVRLHDRFLGALVVRVRLAAEALRPLEGRAALLAGVDGALDAGHLVPAPSSFLTRGASCRLQDRRVAEVALPLRRLLLEDVAREGVPAADLALGGQLEALLRAGMGLHLRHRGRSSIGDSFRPGFPGRGGGLWRRDPRTRRSGGRDATTRRARPRRRPAVRRPSRRRRRRPRRRSRRPRRRSPRRRRTQSRHRR